MANKKNPLLNKLRGYLIFHRRALMLLSLDGIKRLTPTEFVTYLVCVAIADWDRKRIETTYGTYKCPEWQIGELVGRDNSTINRTITKLCKLNLLRRRGDDRIEVTRYEIFDRTNATKFSKEESQKIVAQMENNLSLEQKQIVPTQTTFTKRVESHQDKNFAPIQASHIKAFNFPFKKECLVINDNTDYCRVKNEVSLLQQEIGDKWSSKDPFICSKIDRHQILANALAEYEIKEGILEKEVDKMF